MSSDVPRGTSSEAWRFLVDSGVCLKKQRLAWECLHEFGPMTAQELCSQSRTHGLWKRLPELRALGLVEERPARLCRVSKRKAIVWCAMPPGSTARTPEPKAREWYAVVSEGDHISYSHPDRKFSDTIARICGGEIVHVREVKGAK